MPKHTILNLDDEGRVQLALAEQSARKVGDAVQIKGLVRDRSESLTHPEFVRLDIHWWSEQSWAAYRDGEDYTLAKQWVITGHLARICAPVAERGKLRLVR